MSFRFVAASILPSSLKSEISFGTLPQQDFPNVVGEKAALQQLNLCMRDQISG
jgi:hypothetical protein